MIVALITLIALLMLGGGADAGWAASLEKPIKKQVAEKPRREAALQALDEYADGMQDAEKDLQEYLTQLLNAHLDFQSSAQTFDDISKKLTASQAKVFEQDLKTRMVLKENLSEAEWNAAFKEEK